MIMLSSKGPSVPAPESCNKAFCFANTIADYKFLFIKRDRRLLI